MKCKFATSAVLSALAMTSIVTAARAAPDPADPAHWRAPAGVGDVRLNGYWNIDEAARTAATEAAHAELTPEGQKIAAANRAAAQERVRRGEMVALVASTCGNAGVPFVIGTSEPWLLTIGKDAVVQTAERYQLSPRYFYTDGRSLPDVAKMPKSSSGYSVAHWEGKALIIETRGLPAGGVQGGGLKGPNTKLTERVSLDETGNRLTWTYTWDDAELMAKPLTYSILYTRADKYSYSMYQLCDPNQGNSRLVEAPPQDGDAAAPGAAR